LNSLVSNKNEKQNLNKEVRETDNIHEKSQNFILK